MKIGKWMVADEVERDPKYKTRLWLIYGSDRTQLGIVEWYGRWRQYVFSSDADIVLSDGCLSSLAAFLTTQNQGHRARRDGA